MVGPAGASGGGGRLSIRLLPDSDFAYFRNEFPLLIWSFAQYDTKQRNPRWTS